jgi:hypothetical protein
MTTINVDPDILAILAVSFDIDTAIEVIGIGLRAQSLDVRTFTSDNCRHLKVDHVRSTVADLFIYPSGCVDWDYHSFAGAPHDLCRLIAVTLGILAEPGSPDAATAVPCANTSFLSSIGRAAEERGLSVTFASQEPGCAHLELDDEVAIINPAQPQRGIVQITHDGAFWWNCQLSNQPHSEDGLAPAEIATSIARALTNAQTASPAPQRLPAPRQSQQPAA